MAVDSTIQFKRGKKNDLPYGLEGEPLYCTDTNELYIGQGEGHAPKLINANGTGGGTTENIKAENVNIKDTNNNFTSTHVEGALEEVSTQFKDIANNKMNNRV